MGLEDVDDEIKEEKDLKEMDWHLEDDEDKLETTGRFSAADRRKGKGLNED